MRNDSLCVTFQMCSFLFWFLFFSHTQCNADDRVIMFLILRIVCALVFTVEHTSLPFTPHHPSLTFISLETRSDLGQQQLAGYLILFSTCVSRCPPRSFPNQGGVCWPCHESCEVCAGAGQDSCLSCAPAHLRVTDLAVCLQQCPEGYYESTLRLQDRLVFLRSL